MIDIGDMDQRVRAVLKSMGFTLVFWNRDTEDATSTTVNNTFAQWFSQPKTGTISLQHDLFVSSANQIPATLNMTRTSGYNFKTVVGCLGRNDAYKQFPVIPQYVPPIPTSVEVIETTQS